MATYREHTSKDGSKSYTARVRLRGHQPVVKTFGRKSDAKEWAKRTESAMKERRQPSGAPLRSGFPLARPAAENSSPGFTPTGHPTDCAGTWG